MLHLGDITKISGYDAPVVDCVVGGSPCQDLSVAGKRAGLEGERSGLYIEQVRIVKEMRKQDEINGRAGVDVRPRYMVWENVPGAFSSNKGEDFRIVLEELAKVKDKDAVIPMPDKWTNHGCIMGDGWSIAWRVLDAQFWGVPQRRRRIALVADFGGHSAPEILFVSQSVSGHTDESEPKRKETPSDASRGIGTDDSIGVDIYNTALTGDKVCPLTAGGTTSTGTCPKVMTPVTFEPGIASREGGHIYEGVSGTLRANAGDNQMATAYGVTTKGNGDAFITTERHTALSTGGGQAGQGYPCVMATAYGISSYNSNAMKSDNPHSGIYEADTSRTLDGNGGNPSCNQGGIAIVESVPYTLKIRSGCEGGGKGALVQEDRSATLACNNDQYLFQPIVMATQQGGEEITQNGICPTITAAAGMSGNNQPVACLPVYALDRASFNQGKNASFDFEVSDKGVNSPLVAKGPSAVCYTIDEKCANTYVWEEQANTLAARDYKQPQTVVQAFGFDPSASRDVGQYFHEETANVLKNGSCPGHHNGVCIAAVDCRNATEDEVNGALQSNSAHSLNGNNVVRTRYIVRRLTPLECERLQGYPDGWTDIGEYIDSTGKKRQTSDAARYKALGNSIALPPWKWVLKRLCACYERDATMASLFDGIGGFPYLWEQLNGKGTCLWASEIEEFPMAVTKVRIGGDT